MRFVYAPKDNIARVDISATFSHVDNRVVNEEAWRSDGRRDFPDSGMVSTDGSDHTVGRARIWQ